MKPNFIIASGLILVVLAITFGIINAPKTVEHVPVNYAKNPPSAPLLRQEDGWVEPMDDYWSLQGRIDDNGDIGRARKEGQYDSTPDKRGANHVQ